MFLNICLCSAAFAVVSANNVFSSQTYPIYQQNGFLTPSINQPINLQPYSPSVTTQNQLQQLNISPSSIKQVLLNKLLAGSTAQMILNPNAPAYGMNLFDVPNNHIAGNFVSNNAVVPAEHWNDGNNVKNGKISKHSQSRVRPNRTNNRKLKSKRSQDNEKSIDNNSQKHSVKENRNQRKSNRPKKLQVLEEKSISGSEKKRNNPTRSTNRKRKEQTTENLVEKNSEQNIKVKRRQKKPKKKEYNLNDSKSENQLNNKSIIKEKANIDLDITYDGMYAENRKIRNSKQEVNDILKSHLNTPQQITNHFLTNLNQLNNPLMSNWFANYKDLYQSFLNKQPIIVTESRPKRRKKNKKSKKKKNIQNRNTTANTNNVNPNNFGPSSITTETYPNPIVESFKSFETNDRNMKYTSNEIIQDSYNLNEFEDEYDPGYYEEFVDDYYPVFTDSAAYTANNKEIIVKNLNNNRHFYVTDKSDIIIIPKKHQKPSDDHSKATTPINHEIFKHTYDEIENESLKNVFKQNFEKSIEEEVEFRSPPFLDAPDFRTRQIDKSEIQYTQAFDDIMNRYVGDKSFSAKTANFNSKKNGITPQTKDIETVYAKSKVVAYGPVYIPEENTVPDTTTTQYHHSDHTFTSNSYQGDGTTYIVAESMANNEKYR